jgi:4-hydroxysphinganine ceramide fatty acyl 2-hydroxylase
MESHPGGEEIILQYGGQDITNVLMDINEHIHSDVAYEMLEEYYIGTLEGIKESKKVKDNDQPFIDFHKPMLSQVWNGNFTKEQYVKQVHIPRHSTFSAPIFEAPYFEVFSKTQWWIIPIFWTPIISYCISQCLKEQNVETLYFLFVIGVFLWSFIEYTLHRFVFHLDANLPDHRAAFTLHFLLHGVHHFLPMDRY